MEKYEIELHINKKKVKLKEIIDLLNDIKKIVNNQCAYCERNNIKTPKEKLKLIKRLINKIMEDDKDD